MSNMITDACNQKNAQSLSLNPSSTTQRGEELYEHCSSGSLEQSWTVSTIFGKIQD